MNKKTKEQIKEMSKKEICRHNWKAIYFRKKINGSNNQGWFRIKNYVICDKCKVIVKKKVEITKI